MKFQATAMRTLLSIAAGVLATSIALTAALAQTHPTTATFDPLNAYVGTWVATNPSESAPFLVLRLSEVNGMLTGTMSHFKIGGVRKGEIVWRPLTFAESPIFDVKVADSSLWFVWSGDPPFHGGNMKFVAEGASVASLSLFMSPEEAAKIYADNRGLMGLSPVFQLHREGTTWSEDHQEGPAEDWKVAATARLINQAEFQYRFDHSTYGDYSTLLHSKQLERTRGFNFSVVPIDLQSETEPFPGYAIRLQILFEGSSYHLSIVKKTSTDCGSGVFSDETGVIGTHTAQCSAE
ncbi:MAG TPA: hypothetical protein VNY09_08160 [Candidatus Sulfotelmatobacter sp.]|jgi:hypothetical protein|nr:hypothetical protein [Candidatus Sulfotelmatobacter sp.]